MSVDDGHHEPFDAMPIVSSERSPEELASAGQLRVDIRRAIAELPHKLRDALLLAQSGEHSYEEIGAMVHAPVGTIKWRVFEARRLVRQQLAARGHAGHKQMLDDLNHVIDDVAREMTAASVDANLARRVAARLAEADVPRGRVWTRPFFSPLSPPRA